MDAAQIRGLKPKLRKYLQQYGECFCRCDTHGHLNTYVTGQLSTLDRKSVEPIALAAGVVPRTLQQFLNSLEWDQEQLIDILQWLVAGKHTSEHSIGLIDETSCPKKGEKTPGVQRQWCGPRASKTLRDECPFGLCGRRLSLSVGQRVVFAGELVGRSPALPQRTSRTTWFIGRSGRSPWSCTIMRVPTGSRFAT